MRAFGVIDSTRESARRAPSSLVSRTAPTPSMMSSRRVTWPPAAATRALPWSTFVGAAKRTMTSVEEAAGAAGAAHSSAIRALAPAAMLQRSRSGEMTGFKGIPSVDRFVAEPASAPLGGHAWIRSGTGRVYDALLSGALGALGREAAPGERLGEQALLE